MKAQYENHYLTDRDVANYARQSFATLADHFTEEQNNKLVQFLARGMSSGDWDSLARKMLNLKTNDEARALATYLRSIPEHWVPFGHPHITLRMQAPVPITVQCYKHKIGFVESGESRRYISSRPEYFVPKDFRSAPENKKQGSGGVHPDSEMWKGHYRKHCEDAINLYEVMLEQGISPEQARFVLPQGVELNWVWTGSLYAFANFRNLRKDSHSQQEVRDLSQEVDDIIRPLFPVSWAALVDGAY